jgi:hypothetical protein
MPHPVYQVMTRLCALVAPLPSGTNLGLLHLLWLLVSGRLLATRGAVFPALAACGLAEAAMRRASAAPGQGGWTGAALLARWATRLHAAGRWQPRVHAGYHPLAVDLTGFWRALAGALIRACTQAIERHVRLETAPMSKPANTATSTAPSTAGAPWSMPGSAKRATWTGRSGCSARPSRRWATGPTA